MKGLKLRLAKVRRLLAERPTFAPRYLMSVLASGCGLLLVMMTLSPPTYRDSLSFGEHTVPESASEPAESQPTAVPTAASESTIGISESPDVIGHALPVLYAPVIDDGESLGESAFGLRNRAAINILLRSGYLHSAKETEEGAFLVEVDAAVTDCAQRGRPGSETDTGEAALPYREWAIAVVAAEKFNRTTLHRSLEWTIANIYLRITGRLPDISLGPAQIRGSTVRRYANSPVLAALRVGSLSDVQLRDALADECQSLLLANGVLRAIADESKALGRCGGANQPACANVAVALYGGKRPHSDYSGSGAVLDYVSVVERAESLLNP